MRASRPKNVSGNNDVGPPSIAPLYFLVTPTAATRHVFQIPSAGMHPAQSDFGGEIEEVIDAGKDGIILAFQTTTRGATSRAGVGVHLYPHIETRDGKLFYLYEYADRDEALKPVGLGA